MAINSRPTHIYGRAVKAIPHTLAFILVYLVTLIFPGKVGAIDGVVAIRVGGSHTCAITTLGGVKCWGSNTYGQLGDGTDTRRTSPVDVTGLTTGVTAIVTGNYHTCALTTAGGVKCWGWNFYGQLGDATTTDRTTPVDVSGLTTGVSAIGSGQNHTCAVTTAGGVKCWGWNFYRQLGDTTTTDRTTPVNVSGLASGVQKISGGQQHTCIVTTSGGMKCWGGNAGGQLGDATTTDRATPVDVSGLGSGVSAIALGSNHSCAITAGGGLKCWGYNSVGQVGDGTNTNRTAPVDVTGLTTGVAAVSLAGHQTCAVTTVGAVKCWGHNSAGQLGDGTTTNRTTPVTAGGFTSGVTAIAILGHACAVTTTGGVKCWGANGSGQLGDSTAADKTAPVDVIGLSSGVQSLKCGSFHTCAVTNAGGAKCWGLNNYGQIGDGTSINRIIPVDVSDLTTGAQAVTGGTSHTCALTTAGGVKCWGWNLYGQLGDASTTDRSTPVDVSGLTTGVQILATAGTSSHNCVITTGGGAKCWGINNNAQLGDGTTTQRNTPVNVSGLTSGVAGISLGSIHTCALTTGGGVKCWGSSAYGQVGDGATTQRATPVNVSGLTSGVAAIALGSSHTCALTTGGGVKCWGYNSGGQLGDGTTTQRTTPVNVTGLASGIAAIALGGSHTCALTTGGGVKCWGANTNAQLGDGTTTQRTIPVDVVTVQSPCTINSKKMWC